ncbi:MAG: 50S ribosomal protein L39e [Candidatus Micrarchaeota archaeon]|nr:50S ribosomal protein L39e [Candidatus Micrarchaeota archaeon]
MAKAKSFELKKKLAKALTQNRRIPVFVIARTKRGVVRNPKARHWRTRKLKIKTR